MLSKFSVKKPYTVIVGVVLIMILGYVTFTNMTVDLLPNMNMPYAIVMTTYPGASPEEVETTVTRPVEQSMATISNIKDMMSTSSENASMVMLEFEQTANMDSITVEMRGKSGSDQGLLAGERRESDDPEAEPQYDAGADCRGQCTGGNSCKDQQADKRAGNTGNRKPGGCCFGDSHRKH